MSDNSLIFTIFEKKKKTICRENPNDRSAKEIQHLGPATDFYKRLALECSGQQIAVDVFLLNSQYSDLATICKLYTSLTTLRDRFV